MPAPRATYRLGVRADRWADTSIALGAGTRRDVLADREVAGGARPVAELSRNLPIARLQRGKP